MSERQRVNFSRASEEIGQHTVVFAESDPMLRRVLRDELMADGHQIVGEAADSLEWAAIVLDRRPEVAILSLADSQGWLPQLRLVHDALGDDVAVVVLSRTDEDEAALAALAAGAVGFLSKEIAPDELPRVIRAVMRGEAAISRRLARRVVMELRDRPIAGVVGLRPVRSNLTPREWEVLDLLCQGLDTDDIAEQLVLSRETVRSHVKHVLRKLGVGSRAEAVALAPKLRMSTD